MPWTSLANRLNALPLILAGPILRRTTPDSVSVWLALQENRNVVLRILNADGTERFSNAQAQTPIQLGENLFLICATAKSPSTQVNLAPGTLYMYDIDFGSGVSLAQALVSNTYTFPLGLGYAGLNRPSFVLPAADSQNLRFCHASCRKPHGGGPDALVALDQLISSTATTPNDRPQFLLLTGDQIYADDVADALLHMIMDGVRALMGGWDEAIPHAGSASEFKPGGRSDIISQIGFTAAIYDKPRLTKSHLMSFGEYLLMYVFAWSDLFWGDAPPTFEAVAGKPATRKSTWQSADGGKITNVLTPEAQRYFEELEDLERFRNNLWAVRRVLANIPTYMIFDDHEITDDWYISQRWCRRTLGADEEGNVNRSARRIIANGLSAFAICQAWGNTPDVFADTTSSAHGLLAEIAAWSASKGTTDFSKIEDRLLPLSDQVIAANNILGQPPEPIEWHFVINDFPSFDLIVTNTRTQRQYGGGPTDFPAVIALPLIETQIPHSSKELLILAFPAPYLGFPGMEKIQRSRSNDEARLDSDSEAPALVPVFFEWFLTKLGKAAPIIPDGSGRRRARVLICSGDVHYAFTARLRYQATRPFGNPSGEPEIDLILVQATSSALKNEADFPPNTALTVLGISENRLWKIPTPSIGLPDPLLIYGYNDAAPVLPNARRILREWTETSGGMQHADLMRPKVFAQYLTSNPERVRVDVSQLPNNFLTQMQAADWRYRVAFIGDGREEDVRGTYWGSEAVGYNNLGHVVLSEDSVTCSLWWWPDEEGNPLPSAATQMTASLTFEPFD